MSSQHGSFRKTKRRLRKSMLPFIALFSRTQSFSIPSLALRRQSQVKISSSDDIEVGIGVGIDLGTTNSAIAILEGNEPKIISIPDNGPTMPSVVAFDENLNPLVGNDAIQWEHRHQRSAYRNIKRVIGAGVNGISLDTKKVVPHLVPVEPSRKRKKGSKPLSLLKSLQDAKENPVMLFSLNDHPERSNTISPISISSVILKKLLDAASLYTNQEITRAVVGVPAYFNDAQRDATMEAAKMCGISKVKLLREPEAVSAFHLS